MVYMEFFSFFSFFQAPHIASGQKQTQSKDSGCQRVMGGGGRLKEERIGLPLKEENVRQPFKEENMRFPMKEENMRLPSKEENVRFPMTEGNLRLAGKEEIFYRSWEEGNEADPWVVVDLKIVRK